MMDSVTRRLTVGFLLFAVALSLWAGPAAAAGIFRVNAASTAATPDGATWDSAYKTLQEGTDAAEAAGGGEVWVAEGRYTAVTTTVLTMKAAVGLYGGFCTSETEFSTRDWKANPTVIDGESVRRCVVGADSAVLDGFTVTRGYTIRGTADYWGGLGGGMLNAYASPTVRNCFFSSNCAGLSGGAMANESAAPRVEYCTFHANEVLYDGPYSDIGGGAISTAYGSIEMLGCVFFANRSATSGGALAQFRASLDATNCVYVMNSALGSGGAISSDYYYEFGVATDITHCTFSENTAGGSGGALAIASPLTMTNSVLWNNRDSYGAPEIFFSHPYMLGASVLYSCVRGGYEGAGNISADPQFIDASGGSVQLRPDSPCVDAGLIDYAPTTDFLNIARPQGAGVDMGAYEGTVNVQDMVDLTILASPESAGYTLPPIGTHHYVRGSTAMLLARPTGFRFSQWTGSIFSSEPATGILINRDMTVKAKFVPCVIYADGAKASSGDGSSWGTAFNSLQAAVDAAAVTGGEVWVAKGTYTSTTTPVLTMKPGVFLFGGFAGTETSREQRDWNANTSIIDGEYTHRCVNGASDALLDGFTISAGYSDSGGGMLNERVSPTVAHCIFSRNVARYGGGIRNRHSTTTISDCLFTENMAADLTYNSPYLFSNRYYTGGAISNESGALSISDCRFENNVANIGGGVANEYCTLSITACVFKYNLAHEPSSYENMAGGGALYNLMAQTVLRDCYFTDNEAQHSSGFSGGGAVLSLSDSYSPPRPSLPLLSLYNCIFRDNDTAGSGGGIHIISAPMMAENCSFVNNSAWQQGESVSITSYGALADSIPQPVLRNSIVWSGKESGGQQIADWFAASSLHSLAVTYSCVYDGYIGTGNSSADPLFMNSEIGDLRLSAGSPCIDTGTAEGAPATDLLGIPRPQGAGVDMGAYEYDATPPNAPVVTGPGAAVNTPRPAFIWSSGGNAGAGLFRCGFAEGLWIVQESSDTTFTPSSDLSDGRYILYVQERDVAGNWSASGTCMFLLDTVAPNAPVVGGPASPAMNPKPTWSWTSGGGGAHLYRYGHAEDAWLATDIAEPAFTPQEDLSDGGHALYVQERDEAGNWSASGVFTITIDATAPNAPVVGGVPSPTSNALPAWTWVPGGGDGMGQYRFGFDESAWLAVAVTATGFTPSAPLSDGVYTLFVQERDASGNWSVSGSFAVTVDTTPPGVPVVSGAVVPANSARPTWTWLSGGNGVGLFRFGYAEGAWTAADVPTVTFTPEADLTDGSHTLFVQERDGAGNWSASGSSAVVVNTVVYHRITVETTTGGTVTLDPAQPEGGYPGGTVVTVTATADGDYAFTNWTGALGGNTTPTTLVVDADKTVGVVFTATPAESEGEGEAPPPVTDEEAAQRLTDDFDTADGDGSGALSAAEAMAAVPGITAEQFSRLDSDGDGQVTQDELEALLNPDAGCGCRKSALGAEGLKRRLGDLFLFGLAMTTLLALRARRA